MLSGLCRLVGLLLAVAAAAGPVRGQQTWARISGQPLADAASEWGQKNVDMTFQLPAWTIVSLRDAVFPWAGNDSSKGASPPAPPAATGGAKPFSNGTFTILGAAPIDTSSPDGIASTVIDTGMRVGMVPPLVTSSLVYQNVSLCNLCTVVMTLVGRQAVSPLLLAIFSGQAAVQTVNGIGTIMYLPASTIAWLAYGQMAVARMFPWPIVQQRYAPLLPLLTSLLQRMDMAVDPHEALVMRNNVPRGPAIWRSIDKPGDPLMDFMRREGLLMAPRFCNNGSLLPADMANSPIDLAAGPLFLANSTDEVLRGLANATALAPLQEAAQKPPPGVMIFPQRLTLVGVPLSLAAPLILAGPLSAAARPLVNLTSRSTALFDLGGDGKLLIALLALYLPALPVPAPQPVFSALALSALANASSSSPPRVLVDVYRTTLWLPILDYLALLTLATDGTSYGSLRQLMDGATLRHAALLQPGVQAVQLGNLTWDNFTLAAYTGWGVNASHVLVLPQTPVPAAVQQALAPPPAAQGGSSGGDSSTVGIIVGCTVGGVALLVLAAAAVLLWRRRRTRGGRHHGAPDGGKSLQAAKAAGSMGSTAAVTVAGSTDSKAPPDAVAVVVDDAAAAGASNASDDLAAVLQDHEQELLRRHACAASAALAPGGSSGTGTATATATTTIGGNTNALPSLHRAHEQLMSIVAARGDVRAGAAGAQGAQGPVPVLDHRKVVDRVAARLHGNSVDNTVVLEEVLGKGGGGVVYIGTWRGLPVAVKTITFEVWAADEAAEADGVPGTSKARLRYVQAIMETAISASVGHRHVVATYHYDFKRMDEQLDKSGSGGLKVTNGPSVNTLAAADSTSVPEVQAFKVFLIQELCSCSLRKVLEYRAFQRNPDKLATVGDVLHQVALGLEYLHSKGIIHGDLTPGNILLKLDENEMGRLLAKLADFGFSTRLGQQATHVSNFCAGTPFYTAPEVTTQKRTSLASDIFSFGVVAWEMYAGCAPYTRNAQGALQCNPVFPAYPGGNRPPPEVEQLVIRCMSVDAKLRPPTQELVEVLSRHRGARSAAKVEAGPVREPPGLEELKLALQQQQRRD